MSLRPVPTRWFEMLVAREDVTAALLALARTGHVQLEVHGESRRNLNLADLHSRIEEYRRLAQRYLPYWPAPDPDIPATPGSPGNILERATQDLLAWERQAYPLVQRLEKLRAEEAELRMLAALLRQPVGDILDHSLLAGTGPTLATRLFLLPAGAPLDAVPETLLARRSSDGTRDYLLAVGLSGDIDTLAATLAAHGGQLVNLPASLPVARSAARHTVNRRLETLERQLTQLRLDLDAVSTHSRLAAALSRIQHLQWFLDQVSILPVTENFAWVTGWSSDPDGRQLRAALHAAGVHAIVEYTTPAHAAQAPLVLQNPWWARPFELFARMLGTPEANEADPSRMLVVVAPLLFGYMFGDVGHGLLLCLAGFWLQRRWPVVRLLIANGLAATVFGFVFGSVFGREDLLPALWLNPLQHPLPVLLVPLGGGVVILLLGLLLNAMEFRWRGELWRWLLTEAPVVVLYLSIVTGFLLPHTAVIGMLAVLWYFSGSLMLAPGGLRSILPGAAGKLLENIFQLLVNTLSFVRVGAFALAHGGLSLAFLTLAAATHSPAAGLLILILGNAVVILLEGLVVTIQTTRLILFEFFIRFLQCTGREFHPLAAPATLPDMRREL